MLFQVSEPFVRGESNVPMSPILLLISNPENTSCVSTTYAQQIEILLATPFMNDFSEEALSSIKLILRRPSKRQGLCSVDQAMLNK